MCIPRAHLSDAEDIPVALRLFNTLSRSKEEFRPLDPEGRRVLFYNCGPTVYGPFHCGNARNFVVADVLRRWLAHLGYQVTFVQNITDVDDKIINRAHEEKCSAEDVARKYTDLFFEHTRRLGIRPADHHPKATEFIGPMIAMIARLIERGHAYPSADGSVWFRVASCPQYGELSKKPLDELREGERVDAAQQRLKESAADFCLWKASKPGEPAWDSPWGKGRPGWHIECSSMSTTLLADSIDIHMGGVDLVFPHHENERAQSECATGHPFVRYWVHNGFLNIRNENTGEDQKMSKSLGNVFLIDQLLERYDALTLRHFLISAHYRSPLTFSEDNLRASQAAARRISEALDRATRALGPAAAPESNSLPKPPEAARERIQALHNQFAEAMNDDLNTPEAMSAVFGAVLELNKSLDAMDRPSAPKAESESARATAMTLRAVLLGEFLDVLGLDPALGRRELPGEGSAAGAAGAAGESGAGSLVPALLELLIAVRAEARKRKAFDLADKIRADLAALGIVLEDTPRGTIWKQAR